MGLKKEIELDNGVILNYHRIISVNKITNNATVVEISSYTSEAKRQVEKEAIQNAKPFNVYIHTTFIEKEYVEDETIKDLYEYLKTTEKFKDAENA